MQIFGIDIELIRSVVDNMTSVLFALMAVQHLALYRTKYCLRTSKFSMLLLIAIFSLQALAALAAALTPTWVVLVLDSVALAACYAYVITNQWQHPKRAVNPRYCMINT